jgi:hypothetical protein
MTCESASCHCLSEIGISIEGRTFCSEYCASAQSDLRDICHCGHAGCSESEELAGGAPNPEDRPLES